MRRVLFLSICLVKFGAAYSQPIVSDTLIIKQLETNSKAHPPNLLFVHTDKTIYTNNEAVWFSGYLIKALPNYKEHTILTVSLVREDNRKIVLQEKYIMKNGLSFGSLNLPDTIPPANYIFMAFTNVLDKAGQPLSLFTQPVTIKSIAQQNFKVTLNLLDTILNTGVARVQVNVLVNDAQLKTKPVLEYKVNDNINKIHILKENTFVINIPVGELNHPHPVLHTSVRLNNQVQYLSLKLPEAKPTGIVVRFFPEGGNLTEELESVIGWEVKSSDGLPIALKGILLENGQTIDTLITNIYGIGKFTLKPESGIIYTVKLSHNHPGQDTVYTLPNPVKNGVVIHLTEAIVGDSLRVNLSSKQTRNVQVLVHNYREAFAFFKTEVKSSGRSLKIALPGVPKGISAITILNEFGQPLAERLFFAHYNHKIKAEIHPHKQLYKKRDSIRVTIKLTDKAGLPVQGIVSVAAIQDNRLERSKQQDIESYAYLNDLNNLPQNSRGRRFSDKEYLEEILLVNGWRRFTWQDMITRSNEDTVIIDIPKIRGKVWFNKKPLTKPVSLTVMRGSVITIITTESDGSFIIDQNEFLIREGMKVKVSVNEKNKQPFTIHVYDPFIKITEQLSGQIKIEHRGFTKIPNSDDLQLSGFNKTISLAEVIIKSDKKGGLYGNKGATGANSCGDYVDEWEYLNYPHSAGKSGNTQPIKGKTYKVRTDIAGDGPGASHTFSVKPIVYQGCLEVDNKTVFTVKGVYAAREFYGIKKNDLLLKEPLLQSTLFWKPGILTGVNGETDFSFATGDITGKYRIVVQGMGNDDLIFGESSFIIKEE